MEYLNLLETFEEEEAVRAMSAVMRTNLNLKAKELDLAWEVR